ncbi:glycoside hydrolase family 97 protein [Mucilaginibacter sp. dw_454]|uniref:glycoside hydrolase family 97 protein n=1 Tax=Mucilaginibacter sp. dw_454 TaxID=2720079 RepID=UPI001BD31FF3|nr:glycoside hydrolase family 97 protein [Mucilaginibacter sp. dw_454]
MRCLVFMFLLAIIGGKVAAQSYHITSPDKNISVNIKVDDSIAYSVIYKGSPVISISSISLNLDKETLGKSAKVLNNTKVDIKNILHPLYGKSATLTDNYQQLTLKFNGDYSVIFRAYNEGMAYRFVTALKDSVKVMSEQASFNLPGNPSATWAETTNYTAWELPYVVKPAVADVKNDTRALTPALFAYPQSNVKVVVAEADVADYPGMYIQKHDSGFRGEWAYYPAKSVMGSWGNFVSVVKERENYIAKTSGARDYPWRVVIVTDDDKTLLNNQLIYKLAKPSVLTDTKWIKPGKATWEWWHDAMLPGADIPSGMANRNTVLYKYYVDFAAKNKLEYLMIDAGWSDNYDVKKVMSRVDIREVIRYAKSKNVGVFLWAVAVPLLNDLDKNLDFIKSLGAAGLKVDFFDRDDQQVAQWMEKIAKGAAERHLMIDFHGCGKPSGIQRTYPNIMNYEAVRGEECDKWDFTANPQHHLTFTFTRMLAGPLDYTPGSMRNATMATFKPIDGGLPSSLGTRCHELAMYVVYDQYLAMLSDSPTEYEKYPDILTYLSAVPSTFDETKVLDGKVGAYAMIAKRKGKNWFVGAMTNWDERKQNLDFSFLPKGVSYKADIYTDGADANTVATSYTYKTITVTNKTKMELNLAKGGGAALYIHQ